MLIIVEYIDDRYLIDITRDVQTKLKKVDAKRVGYSRYPILDHLTGQTKLVPFMPLYNMVFNNKKEIELGPYKLYRYD